MTFLCVTDDVVGLGTRLPLHSLVPRLSPDGGERYRAWYLFSRDLMMRGLGRIKDGCISLLLLEILLHCSSVAPMSPKD